VRTNFFGHDTIFDEKVNALIERTSTKLKMLLDIKYFVKSLHNPEKFAFGRLGKILDPIESLITTLTKTTLL